MKKLLLLISLLLATNAWALEQEDAIELTCRLNDVVVQFHIGENTNKSWYKLTRESNQLALDHFNSGKSWRRAPASIRMFFMGFKYKNLNQFFDVPHYRVGGKGPGFRDFIHSITDNNLDFMVKVPLETWRAAYFMDIKIDRISGQIKAVNANGRAFGNCLPGLIEWEFEDSAKQERRF
jgi:hypothetical protein